MTSAVIQALSETDRLIGRLAGVGGQLPNPHIFIRPFVRREAVLSSKIEGTQATLGEILAVEAGASVDRSPSDLREVGNYVVALEHGVKRLNKLPLSLRLICELHKKLMTGVRGGHATPGEFRKSQNWIGPPGSSIQTASFVPPPPEELMACLGEWEKFLHQRDLPPLVAIALAHYQFEAIHPFLDGNGRVGRLLITLFLIEREILPTPLLYLSAYFESKRAEYYRLLRDVSFGGAWAEWIEFFLRGVAHQSEDAVNRAERINALLTRWRKKVAGSGSSVPMALIDLLAENPYCMVKRVAERLGVAFTTAQRGIGVLEKAGVLAQVGEGKRDRVYCAGELLRTLERPS
ncbi:MAG: Fic family protein [Candidatus Zixiibacteriota bacterium]